MVWNRLQEFNVMAVVQGPSISNEFRSLQESGYLTRSNDGLRAGLPGFDSWQCKIFLFPAASRPTFGPIQPPILWVPGALPPGSERQGREADHSFDLVPRSRMMEQYILSLMCLHGLVLNCCLDLNTMWHVDPLLGNYDAISNYTTTFAR
jgi:hypothetical protein